MRHEGCRAGAVAAAAPAAWRCGNSGRDRDPMKRRDRLVVVVFWERILRSYRVGRGGFLSGAHVPCSSGPALGVRWYFLLRALGSLLGKRNKAMSQCVLFFNCLNPPRKRRYGTALSTRFTLHRGRYTHTRGSKLSNTAGVGGKWDPPPHPPSPPTSLRLTTAH